MIAHERLSEPTTSPRAKTISRGTVIVADDDPDCTRALASLLRFDGFEVSVANDGAQALVRVEKERPDVVVTDVHMPGLDGLALLRTIRARFPDTIVIVMSGQHHGAASVLEGGALAYVAKPFNVDDVVSVIDAGLQMRDERRRARDKHA